MRVRPLRYREYFILRPLRVDGGYTNGYYDAIIFDTLRPLREYRSRILPLFSRFRLDSMTLSDRFTYMSFDLSPGEEPAPLPERLARLKSVADIFVRTVRGDKDG